MVHVCRGERAEQAVAFSLIRGGRVTFFFFSFSHIGSSYAHFLPLHRVSVGCISLFLV